MRTLGTRLIWYCIYILILAMITWGIIPIFAEESQSKNVTQQLENDPTLAEDVRTADYTLMLLRNITGAEPPLVPKERVARCLALLKLESEHPSSSVWGLGGGPIDSGYVRGVIIGSICTFSQKNEERSAIRTALRERLSNQSVNNYDERDILTVALGFTYDPDVVKDLLIIINTNPHGYLRYSAARALSLFPEELLKTHLLREDILTLRVAARSDGYLRIRVGKKDLERKGAVTKKIEVYSPVRESVNNVLAIIKLKPETGDPINDLDAIRRIQPLLWSADNQVVINTTQILMELGSKEAKEIVIARFLFEAEGNERNFNVPVIIGIDKLLVTAENSGPTPVTAWQSSAERERIFRWLTRPGSCEVSQREYALDVIRNTGKD